MRYLPNTVRLLQRGLVTTINGFGDYRDGHVVFDFHGLLGKYEMEEELANAMTTTFNNFMVLHSELSPDYNALLELYNEQRRKK